MPDAGQIQNAWFHGQSYSLHPGYIVTKHEQYEFAALSEDTNHKAEAIMTSLKPVLDDLIDAKNIKHITVASDSTVSQYRNGRTLWLMQNYAKAKGVTIRWIFSETHHGKCLADGTGGRLKNKVKDLNVFNRDFNINSIEDIIEILEPHTSCKLYTYKKEDIAETKEKMPKKISPLKGALKIHEMLILPNGLVKTKDLPTDEIYRLISCRALRLPVARNRIRRPVNRIQEVEESTQESDESEEVMED
jgi:hypothetical protein